MAKATVIWSRRPGREQELFPARHFFGWPSPFCKNVRFDSASSVEFYIGLSFMFLWKYFIFLAWEGEKGAQH